MTWWISRKPYLRPSLRVLLIRLLPVSFILFGAWYAFLKLVRSPPIEATPVLVMVWASVLLLILASFPKVFDRVKTIKVKDFEIELQEAVAKSVPEDYLPIETSGNEPLFSEKGDLKHLQKIIRDAIQEPDRPVLLLVNLKGDEYISIVMLYKYLFFLDVISMKTIVLFVSSQDDFKRLINVPEDALIGAISGKRVLHAFYRRFPRLLKIFQQTNKDKFFSGSFETVPSEEFLRSLYSFLQAELKDSYPGQSEFLTESNVRAWFKKDLSSRRIAPNLNPSNVKSILVALSEGDEFLLAVSDSHLQSIVPSCELTNRISQKVLADLQASALTG